MKFIAVFFIFLLYFEKPESKRIFDAKEFTLKNGLQVVIVENPRAPVVAQMIWYNFGSDIESPGKSGLAHFMEHLMFKGTQKYPESFFSNFLSKIGGSENAFTSYDYTAYYQIFPSEHLEKVLELEADRMKNLVLSKKNVQTEKKVILEERFQRVESNPSAQLDESMRNILYPNNYYGRPIIGWKHEIENLSYEDVIKFYQKNYSPENAVLVLSGNVKLKDAKKLVKKYYGNFDKVSKKKRVNLIDPDLKTLTKVELRHPNVKQQIWKRIYRTKSYMDSIEKAIALDIGLKILAGGSSSILYDELVNKKKTFSMIGGFYQGLTRGQGYVYFYAIPNKRFDDDELNKLIEDEVEKAIETKVTEDKLELEKKKYYFDSIYGMDGVLKPAEIIGEALTVGLNLNDIENWNNKLKKISLDMVKKELEELSRNKNFVTGNLKN
ncbi:MAG: M16 family metallopeptidase [Alphaproteobacteria bacterium]